jgi:Zn-dependent membrane protease YugP
MSGWFFLGPSYLAVLLPGLLLSLVTQWYVRATFRRYAEQRLRSRLRGAEVAAVVLERAGVRDVVIEETSGVLSDHYDPTQRVLRLSPDVYRASSLSAAGVAAHEAGHAIQHAEHWGLMPIRQALVLPARIGSQLALVAIGLGLAIHAAGLAWLGVALFVALFLFELVTLPIELDASARARAGLIAAGIVDAEELEGVSRVLRAAALTYVAALVATALQLLYFVTRVRQDADQR